MYKLLLGGAYIEITSYCNRNCPYCYNDSTIDGIVLNKELVFRIIDECHNCGISSISISGGEPFAHPNIYEILSRLDALHMRAVIITNLSLLSLAKAVEVAKRGHVLQVSLDYPEEKMNDYTRGKGSYRLVFGLLDRFRREGLIKNLILRYNVGKNNSALIEKIIGVAMQYGIKTLDVALLFKSGRGCTYDYVFDYMEDMHDIGRLMHQLSDYKKNCGDALNLSYTKLNDQLGCVLFGDGELTIGPKIEPNGDVYICQLFSGSENVLGNIKDATLCEILSSEKAYKVVDKVRKRKQIQSECENCGFTDVCMCGCPAVSYNQTGSLFDKNDQCSMIKYFLKERVKQIGV